MTVTDFVDMPLPAPETVSLVEQSFEFLRYYWPTLGLMGLVAFSLIVLRSAVRAAPIGSPATAATMAPTEVASETKEEQQKQEKKKWRTAETAKSLRDEIAELVAEDPETAANILKTWIGNPI